MTQQEVDTGMLEVKGHTPSTHPSVPLNAHNEEKDWLAESSGKFLDHADSVIYAIVGICFLIGAFIALGYSFWDFGGKLIAVIHAGSPTQLAPAIIQFVSDLLLVLIIMEVLGTVTHYLKSHETSLRPFLFIGIVSATRSILSIGARLSIAGSQTVPGPEFTNAMIELGVSAAVVLALGVTLKLLGRLVDAPAD